MPHEALLIPEILESVLIQLDYNDLIKCLRVSRSFKATIEASILCQRLLWLDEHVDQTPYEHETTTLELHPFLKSRLGGSYGSVQHRFGGQSKTIKACFLISDLDWAEYAETLDPDRNGKTSFPNRWRTMPCSKPAIMSMSNRDVVVEASLRCLGCKNHSARYYDDRVVEPFQSLHELMAILTQKEMLPPYIGESDIIFGETRRGVFVTRFDSWLLSHESCKRKIQGLNQKQFQYVVMIMTRGPGV